MYLVELSTIPLERLFKIFTLAVLEGIPEVIYIVPRTEVVVHNNVTEDIKSNLLMLSAIELPMLSNFSIGTKFP